MFLLISYLASLTACAIQCTDPTKLIITDVASISFTDLGNCQQAKTATITYADGTVTVGQQAFNGFNFETVTIDAKAVVLDSSAFQQCTISTSLSIVSQTTISIGQSAFTHATLGGIEIKAPGDITITQQGFQQITKAANISIVTNGSIQIGESCFTNSAIAGVHFEAVGNITLDQNAFLECTGLTTLYMSSTQGGIVFGKTAFIKAAIDEVYLYSYLDCNIDQQAMQEVARFDNLVVETQSNFIAGQDSFIQSTIKQFHIHSHGNVSFYQEAFQETKNLVNFTVIANDTIDFGQSSFINSNVNSIYLSTNGQIIFGQQSFQGCINLSSVVIDSTANVTFGNSAFISSQIHQLNISNHNATSGARLLEDGSTISFETQSFSQCNQLTNVNIDTQGNVNVGANSFQDSTALNHVHIKSTGKTTVGDNAFKGCTSLDKNVDVDAGTYEPSDNMYGDGGDGDDDDHKKKGGSSSHKDSDDIDESSAKTLGNFEIKSVYLGTSPNIVVDLNIFVTLMRNARKALGKVVPPPDFIHSAIWVGKDGAVDDKSVGAIFVYGKYWNKYHMNTYLGNDGAKAYVMTLGDFKKKYPSINPMKLNVKKEMKLFDFINEIKERGNWGARDYNWPTNNCQHFTAKLIDILHATRDVPTKEDWIDLPKPVMNSLEANEKN